MAKDYHFKAENKGIVHKFHIFIVILLVDMFERPDVEELEGTEFQSWPDYFDYLKKLNPAADTDNVQAYTLSEFTLACNDQEIELEGFWLTYVKMIEHEG